MESEEILELWEIDSKVDVKRLVTDLSNIGQLHHKYYKIYVESSKEVNRLKNLESKMKIVLRDYYSCILNKEALDALKRKPYDRILGKMEIQQAIAADKKYLELFYQLQLAELAAQTCKDILAMISKRNTTLSAIIEAMKLLGNEC